MAVPISPGMAVFVMHILVERPTFSFFAEPSFASFG
jgi:hypothetical protein